MKLASIISAVAVVANWQAGQVHAADPIECTATQLEVFDELSGDSGLSTECELDAISLFTSPDVASTPLCAKPKCKDFVQSSLDKLPDCAVNSISLELALRAAIGLCETEKSSTEPANTTETSSSASASSENDATLTTFRSSLRSSGSADTVDSDWSSHTTTIATECTLKQQAEIRNLGNDEGLQNVCDVGSKKTFTDVSDAPLCSSQQCFDYAKNTLVNKIPDCTISGTSIKTAFKLALAMCEEAGIGNSAASVSSVGVVALMSALVAAVALI